MAAQQTTWSSFGPDPQFNSLDPAFQSCIHTPSANCDVVVGSATSGQGFCADSRYSRTTYCACVNNSLVCPEKISPFCANSALAYMPTNNSLDCTNLPCINLVEVGGSQNIVNNVTQECGTINNVTNAIRASPVTSFLFFIILIAIIAVLISMNNERQFDKIIEYTRRRNE